MAHFFSQLNRILGRHWDVWFTPHPNKDILYLYLAGALAFCIILFIILQKMPRPMRKTLIKACTFIAGLFFVLEFAIPGDKSGDNFLSAWIPRVGDAAAVIGCFTWGLGLINLTHIHGKAILRRRPGWINSLGFFIGFFGMCIFGFWKFYAKIPDTSHSLPAVGFSIFFNGFYQNLGSTVFSLLAFYIVSAAYRAFRVRSGEATVMMLAAFLVMLGQVPLGQWFTQGLTGPIASNFRIEVISEWLLTGINGAAQRGIAFGMAVGALAMSLRIWLSLERGSFFDSEV